MKTTITSLTLCLAWLTATCAICADNQNQPASAKIRRYVQRLIEQYDADRDGKLQAAEWQKLSSEPDILDANHDGIVTAEELTTWISTYGRTRRLRVGSTSTVDAAATPADGGRPASGADSPAAAAASKDGAAPTTKDPRGGRPTTRFYVPRSRLPAGLPAWFTSRDTDGDAQLTFSEFSPKDNAADLEEFRRMDRNGDGIVTAEECVRGTRGGVKPKSAGEKTAPKEKSEK